MAHAEIERKFVVPDFARIWAGDTEPGASSGTPIAQGYLIEKPHRSLRVRLTRDGATLTLKGPRHEATRIEIEESISVGLAAQLLSVAEPNVVTKIRYPLVSEDRLWVVDRFQDRNEGLVIAEAELASPGERLAVPSWCGPEVTEDERYYNESLARHPFSAWS